MAKPTTDPQSAPKPSIGSKVVDALRQAGVDPHAPEVQDVLDEMIAEDVAEIERRKRETPPDASTLRARANEAWARHHAGEVRPGQETLGSYADLARRLELRAAKLEAAAG